MKKLTAGIFFLICITSFWACDTPEAYGDLIISVLDDRGNVDDSAEVTLFLTREDYNQENNIFLGPSLTDANGELKFFNLTDSVYYINVSNGVFNNWENAVKIDLIKSENGFNNHKTVIISNSKAGVLSSPQGKTWSILSLNTDVNVPACLLDNQFVFLKGGGFQQLEGVSRCQQTAPDTLIAGNWRINRTGTEILMDFANESLLIVTFTRSEIALIGPLSTIFPGEFTLDDGLAVFTLNPE